MNTEFEQTIETVLDQVQTTCENKKVALMVNNKSIFKLLEKRFPGIRIILVQNKLFKNDTVYIIPYEDKPIKFTYEGED